MPLWSTRAALLMAGVSLALTASGGEPAAARPPVADRGFWEWDSTGRRDPLEFRSAVEDAPPVVVEVASTAEATRVETTAEDRQKPQDQNAVQIRQLAEDRAGRAEFYLGQQQFGKAEEAVQEAITKLKGLQVPDATLLERLERIRLTAVRMRTRAELEREFKSVSIDIQGIIWAPERRLALIRGRQVQEGDVVEGALVEEIRTNEIIFNYKGVRCRRQPGH